MNQLAAAAVLGILPLLVLPRLPTQGILWLIGCAICGLWWQKRRVGRLLAVVLGGLLWGCWVAGTLLLQINSLSERPLTVIATVSSVALGQTEPQKVVFQLQQVDGRWIFPPIAFTAYLDPQEMPYCAGQRWRLTVELRPVHSRLNQGGFDGQRWAIANRQPLSAKISQVAVLDGRCSLRQRIVSRVSRHLTLAAHRALLIALAFGETGLLNQEQRALFLKTGTAHLIAISGLHISMSALFGWGVMRASQFLLPVHAIGYRVPLMAGWLVAICYVWLAGANPPAIRAGLALTMWFLLRLRGVRCPGWQIWLWGVAIILISDPLAVLSDSFWLSCLAVGALIFWFTWAPLPERFNHGWRWEALRWLHLQSGMTVLLLPLQVGLFQGISLASLPANLWAVPLVTFGTVPLLLFALASDAVPLLAPMFWKLANLSLELVQLPLNWLQQSWLTLAHATLSLSILGWLSVVVWRFQWWRHQYATIAILMMTTLLPRTRPAEPLWRVDMLDIGHGLAVLIERNGKATLYDTADEWEGGSAAEFSILPHLRWRGIELQEIILSHSHSDHVGGVAALRSAFPLVPVRSSSLQSGYLSCRRGERWRWQGLDFQVLWPPERVTYAGNGDSCTLRVSDGKWSVLLTGDLDAASELRLVRDQWENLAATVLQVAHHGSKTSSSSAFIAAVRPEVGLASLARYGRWRLPADKIVRRYRDNRVLWRDTARSGQLSVLFFDQYWQINGFREQLMPRWYHQWFGVRGDNE